MNKEKYEFDKNFPFDSLYLANPSGLQGGAYFSKIKINDERILLQIPKCQTKNGIHITEKKIYTDLMHSSDKESFQVWIDTFTSKIKELLYEKKDIWFSNDMSSDDIDFFWKDVLRKYRNIDVIYLDAHFHGEGPEYAPLDKEIESIVKYNTTPLVIIDDYFHIKKRLQILGLNIMMHKIF